VVFERKISFKNKSKKICLGAKGFIPLHSASEKGVVFLEKVTGLVLKGW